MRATDWQSAAENLAARVAFGNAADALLEAAERGGNAPVACACSGGADSLCALLLLWAKFPRLRERLLVLHYDHAAREDSAADAEFVRRVAAALGVPAREIEAALAEE
ncbi:MAG: ATP-binding protein, partial [Candidatus Spyradosoma sp.]